MLSAIRRRTNYGPRPSRTKRMARPLFLRSFPDKSGSWSIRYYQQNAVENALEAVAAGRKRILLTLATGTGKTVNRVSNFLALFQSRWNLSGEPTRRPRILFLADRNNLANQAYNAFSAFRREGADPNQTGRNPQERPRTQERQRLLHDLPDLHERHRMLTASLRRILVSIRRTFSISLSSTSAIAAAQTTKATGATFSTISNRRFSLA